MSRSWRAIRATLLWLGVAACSIASLEWGARAIDPNPIDQIGGSFEIIEERPNADRIDMRRNLGWYFVDSEIRNRRTDADGKPVYDATYRFDSRGRRRVPAPASTPRHHLLFSGGSFAMGHGLAEDRSLPARLQRQLPDTRVYNYGMSGYSPTHVLRLLELKHLRSEVPEKTGAMVYLYIDDHLRRVLVSARVAAWSHGNFPTYRWMRDDRLLFGGIFRDESPLRAKAYAWLGHSHLLRRVGLDWPLFSEQRAVRYTARVLDEIARRYTEQFDSDQFYVLFFPRHDRSKSALISELDARGIKHIDLGIEDRDFPDTYFFPDDMHPNARGIEKVARHLGPTLRAQLGSLP